MDKGGCMRKKNEKTREKINNEEGDVPNTEGVEASTLQVVQVIAAVSHRNQEAGGSSIGHAPNLNWGRETWGENLLQG